MSWAWIPITIWAAFAQTFRNAAQRHLTRELGTLGATLVRFLYGLPFALLWLLALRYGLGFALPAPNWSAAGWTVVGALGQLIATALLLRTMEERNFAVGVIYSKTEIVQIAVFAILLLGDPLSLAAAAAIALVTLGLIFVSLTGGPASLASLVRAWSSPAARFGLGSGAAFAISTVGYRGAALALKAGSLFMAAGYVLVAALALQVLLLGGWLVWRDRAVIVALFRAWRLSLAAGLAGAAGSAGWLTAMALEPVAHVRTLGLVEIFFSYAVSRRIFKERIGRLELAGIVLIASGVALIAAAK